MSALLLDTNVVSILFNLNHSLRGRCIDVVSGHELAIAFMTRAELLLWPIANNWAEPRRSALAQHLNLYTTLYPDEQTCAIWADVIDLRRRAGRQIQTADAWIASTARQWQLRLVTTDFRDYESVDNLDVVPIVP